METALSFLLGIATGFLGALLGIGGGVVIVPFLVFIAGFAPPEAIGSSMLVVLMNASSGTLGYLRQKLVCYGAAVKFGLATLPGAALGSYAAEFLQGRIFYLVFGFFFLFVAANMYYKAGSTAIRGGADAVPADYNWQLGTICSVGVGFLAGVLGIGGGIVHVPFMIYILKFPVRIAIATSTCILAISALAGVITHAWLGHIAWITTLAIGAGASLGAQLGVLAAARLKSAWLMKLMALLVCATGCKFLWSSW